MHESSHMPRYGFDIDGTLFSVGLILQRFGEITGRHVTFSTMTAYSFADDFGLSRQEEYDIFSRIKSDVNLHSKPLQRTVSLAKAYKGQGCEVDIITARRQSALSDTQAALGNAGIPYDHLFMDAHDKEQVIRSRHLDRYFDDQGALIEALMDSDVSSFCELTLVDAPYNHGYRCHSRLYV
ncbi:MAG: hypothetical protein LKF49_03005 [Bifidobacterium tibiigranuli]|uniref:hypothetical protein n=1 Tax=Bifidobacterium tibiigranuli TaxID=2172043 RepID=UPI0023571C05|nr:hypothetical protein [Bifidobacterium tibiigranuli]MCH3974366.1 hypothetical protein [Bifidobacterium tibiigranuli]MCH4188929.1 hypothetical protein [Bifidobacterium tibiigranuli]MCH4203166.1 hypothetical protein [Bifidobacterium tibiigranuli]MCH4273399.1 hypothetical protein [Bifidobacterium tibiigranuli]MCI1790513.1 hypothetical protein [Bifidobacterium tibiigranuli]